MSPLSASPRGTARAAVIGSATSCGTRLREKLVEYGVPGSRVDLYATVDAAEPILSEYDGEARLIQKPDLDEVLSRDVVFVCEPGDFAAQVLERAAGVTATIDVANARPVGSVAKLVHMDVNPSRAAGRGLYTVPHDLTTLLADLLQPLDRELGCAEVVTTILRPASDFGEAGVEELRDQTVRLLNFAQPKTDVFGRQVAFNVLPQSVLPDKDQAIEARVAEEISDLLGWNGTRLTLGLAAAPVFFGHSLSVRLRFTSEIDLDRVRAVLGNAGLTTTKDEDRPATPMDVSSEQGIHVADVGSDGLGGIRMWAVAGGAHRRNAELAVRLAAALCDL